MRPSLSTSAGKAPRGLQLTDMDVLGGEDSTGQVDDPVQELEHLVRPSTQHVTVHPPPGRNTVDSARAALTAQLVRVAGQGCHLRDMGEAGVTKEDPRETGEAGVTREDPRETGRVVPYDPGLQSRVPPSAHVKHGSVCIAEQAGGGTGLSLASMPRAAA